MCYVLEFEINDSYKACKFTAFPRTFQIINYLFFKEVFNPNNVRGLSCRICKPYLPSNNNALCMSLETQTKEIVVP